MKIPMAERRVLVKNHAREYQRSGKKEKGRLLSHFVEATGLSRVYAARLLRNHGRRIVVGGGLEAKVEAAGKLKRKRDREYGAEAQEALKFLQSLLGFRYLLVGKDVGRIVRFLRGVGFLGTGHGWNGAL